MYREVASHGCFAGQVLDCHLLESKEIKSDEHTLRRKGTTLPEQHSGSIGFHFPAVYN